jgi:HD superfamily phosphohydrolase
MKGTVLPSSKSLLYFLNNKITTDNFDSIVLNKFSQLDDYDIISAIKEWQDSDDFILSSLSKMIINRDLLKVKLSSEKFDKEVLTNLLERFSKQNNCSLQDAKYFIFKGKIENQAYSKDAEPIHILKKDKTIEDVVEASDQLNLKALSKPVTKYYICYPKQLIES